MIGYEIKGYTFDTLCTLCENAFGNFVMETNHINRHFRSPGVPPNKKIAALLRAILKI
jgi:hypothetical protein